MTLKLKVITFILVAILYAGLANAQTLIAGKVYDSSYNIVPDATVKVTCNYKTLATKTLSDGTYAVKFDNSVCPSGSIAEVYAEKDNLAGENEGSVRECGDDCDDDYVSVVNVNTKEINTQEKIPSNKVESENSGGGGGGSRRTDPVLTFICGNGVCDSGETQETCSSDCYVEPETETQETSEETRTIDLAPEEKNNDGSSITGAFIAAGNSINLPILSGILGFLVILLIGHKIIQRKNKF